MKKKNLENQYIVDNLDNRFIDIATEKAHYLGQYPLIDLGIGEDKDMPSLKLNIAIKKALRKKENHKYSDLGIEAFKKEVIKYLKRKEIYVEENEILPIMGAKSILAILPLLYLSEGDVLLTLRPSYVVFEKIAKFIKAEIRYIDINSVNPDEAIKNVKKEVWEKVKVLNLNFPHNPTGSSIKKSTYQYLIKLAKKYNFLIINDATYIDVNYERVHALFEQKSAKDVGLEIYSLSKGFNMTGYRLGFIIGNTKRIGLIGKFKDCFDSGQFIPLEYAGIKALSKPKINRMLVEKYHRRLIKLQSIFANFGLECTFPKGTFYLYIKVPKMYKSAREFAMYLLKNLGIMTIPYDDYGSYIRVSATFDSKKEKYIYEQLERRLKNLALL